MGELARSCKPFVLARRDGDGEYTALREPHCDECSSPQAGSAFSPARAVSWRLLKGATGGWKHPLCIGIVAFMYLSTLQFKSRDPANDTSEGN